ncbi:hypothetical protein [Actinotalea solisilvae]|uniref:hypothetical protein n=1 Tax=Actinotalea solisilvae TaxID=2072922 RepID=UPI0018F203BC|nr:hypothetical protein [Actinotalea solisilvae]
MTPLLTVLPPGARAARRTRGPWTSAVPRAAAGLVAARLAGLVGRVADAVADHGDPPRGPDERHWAVGTSLGHHVQDVP